MKKILLSAFLISTISTSAFASHFSLEILRKGEVWGPSSGRASPAKILPVKTPSVEPIKPVTCDTKDHICKWRF